MPRFDSEPSLRPDSPVQGMQVDLDKERVNDADLTVYMATLQGMPATR